MVAALPIGAWLSQVFPRAIGPRALQVGYLLAGLGWLTCLALMARGAVRLPGVGGAPALSVRRILAAAIVVRVLLLPLPPADDAYRYLWEGRVRLAGHNPYLAAPDDPRVAHLRDADWERINHPNHAAIYPPVMQVACVLVAGVAPHAYAFKLAAVLADVTVIGVIVGWLRRRGEPPAWVAIYALCPATLHAFAIRGQADSCMLLALTALLRYVDARVRPDGEDAQGRLSLVGGESSVRAMLIAGVLLGVAIGLKWVAVVLAPWLMLLAGRSPRRWRGMIAVSVGATLPLVLAALPYADAGAALLGPLAHFGREFRMLDFGRQHLVAWLGDAETARTVAMLLVVGMAAVLPLLRFSAHATAVWTLGGGLLVAPTVHPWYLTWLLPALCVARHPAWLVLPITMTIWFDAEVAAARGGSWSLPDSAAAVVFLPVMAAIVMECAWRLARPRAISRPPSDGG